MHPLLFHESFGHKLVDGGLYEAGGNTLATSVPLAVVDDGIGIVVDIDGKLLTVSYTHLTLPTKA